MKFSSNNNAIVKSLKIAWGVIWTIILIVTIHSYNSTPDPEIVLSAWITMFYLSFPGSMVTSFILMGVNKIYTSIGLSGGYEIYPLLGYLDILIIWTFSCCLGYLQWFVLLPFGVKFIKNKALFKQEKNTEIV